MISLTAAGPSLRLIHGTAHEVSADSKNTFHAAIEAVARYVEAIGGQIQISAVFGDDHYILRGTVTEAPNQPPSEAQS